MYAKLEPGATMLSDHAAMATVAVKDLEIAKAFYEGTLGLTRIAAQGEEAVTYATGQAGFVVYRSAFAGTNKATAVSWTVGPEIDALTELLAARGFPSSTMMCLA